MHSFFQWLRSVQPAYQAHLVGLLFVAIFMLVILVSSASESALQILLLLASLAFATGFSIWCWPTVKNFWGHPVGRVVIVTLHIFVLLFAAIFARNVVASALGLPPQDFDVSVSFITLVLYIPAWSIVVSILIGSFALFLYLIGFFITFFSRNFKESAKLFAHAAGALAICFCSASIFDFTSENEKYLYPLVRWVALFGDFQIVEAYPGVDATERVRLHENGVISVATVENNTVVIRVRKYD